VARRTVLVAGLLLATCCPAVAAAPPYPNNTSAPTVNPRAEPRQVGQTLTVERGGWETAPSPATTSYTYVWLRCGIACQPIAGASGEAYTIVPADVGSRLRARVTANCSAPGVCRPSEAESAATGVVLADPVNESPPEISGEPRRGQRLAASAGFWRSSGSLSFSYQWRRCDPGGNACVDIPGATRAQYVTALADLRRTLRVAVTGQSQSGRSATATSGYTAPIARSGPAPRRVSRGLRLLSPFPTIVVAGVVTPSGSAFREFSIRGPRTASVRIHCRGRGCPFRSRRFRLRKRRVRVRSLQRALGAGARITVVVARRGFIGKYSRFRIRAGRVPARTDACLRPGERRPSRCPRRR
jgi:hypothetical protein